MKPKLIAFLIALVVLIPQPASARTIKEAPSNSHCPGLYRVVTANWPGGAAQWRKLDAIIYRESRCKPGVVNRFGCVGLMQICRGNHSRMRTNTAALKNPATNIRVAYALCRESMRHHHSCWQPWAL